jgi:hypothetical protein
MGKLTKGKRLVAESLLIGGRDGGFDNLDSTKLWKRSIGIRRASAFSDASSDAY